MRSTFIKTVKSVIIPVLWRDISILGLGVFALCFASFAVPLLIGGVSSTTTEVLIYELIRIDQNWSYALITAALQAATIIALSFLISSRAETNSFRAAAVDFLGFKYLSAFALFPSLVLIAGMFAGLADGAMQLYLELPAELFFELALNSFVISFSTAGFSLLLLVTIAFAYPEKKMRKILLGLVAPSSILTGFALIIIWRDVGFATLIKIVLGLTLIFVPVLYRLGWDAKLTSLREQVQTASVLGASRWLILKQVLWPQLRPLAARLSALAAFWAWGDFALSKMVAERTMTIALMVQSLMSSYRLNPATALLWLMLIGSAVTYFLVWGLVNVSSRKSSH